MAFSSNKLRSRIEPLLEPFVEQAATVRSIVAIDWPNPNEAILIGASPVADPSRSYGH